MVATPIGNLADISLRALYLLGLVDCVACEDTRHSQALLRAYGIDHPGSHWLAVQQHNEAEAVARVLERLHAGQRVAYISDAGTPAISAPGFRLVRACRRRGLPVIPIPGACAVTAVLSASGLPTNGFLFAGFLIAKTSARTAFLEKYRDFEFTLALYESCHRIDKFAEEIVEKLGPDRVICIAREVSKLHETWLVGRAGDVRDRLLKGSLKGEFVVLIAPADFVL